MEATKKPCINNCLGVNAGDDCKACLRTAHEHDNWLAFSDYKRAEITNRVLVEKFSQILAMVQSNKIPPAVVMRALHEIEGIGPKGVK